MAENALVVTSIDGLNTLQCGIGSMVSWFFEGFSDLVRQSAVLSTGNFHLYAVAPQIDRDSPDYSERTHQIVSDSCRSTGGKCLEFSVSDGQTLQGIWSLENPESWEEIALKAASLIRKVSKPYRKVTVLVHGLMLTILRKYLLDCNTLQVVFVAHSLGRVFGDKQSDARSVYEDESFQIMGGYPQDKVAYVSSFFEHILRDQYSLSDNEITPLRNGILKSSYRFNSFGETERRKYNIPWGKRILFSWGRCTGQKGFDIIIKAFADIVKEFPECHLVLLMPQSCSPRAYVAEIDELLSELDANSYTKITSFDENLPLLMMRQNSLEAVVVASRFESYGLTAMEARLFSHPRAKFVYTPLPPLMEIFDRDHRAFCADDLSDKSLYRTLRKALLATVNPEAVDNTELPECSFVHQTSVGLDKMLNFWRD